MVSTPTASNEEELDTVLFSPPLFTTINKRLEFYENIVRSPVRFGVVQLNSGIIDEEVREILSTIGRPYETKSDEEKIKRCFNVAISEYGKLTNNPEAEHNFVEMLKSQNFKCSLEQVTSTFGPGVYIMSTCSPLLLKITGTGLGKTIPYSSEEGIKKPLNNPSQRNIIDKAVYAFNNDLENIIYHLNYRWMEMVQHVPEFEPQYPVPYVDVQISKEQPYYSMPMFERPVENDDDERATEPDEDMSYMNNVGGSKKRQRQRRTRKTHRKRKTRSKRVNRRPTRTRRRSKYYPSRA
jgi:hypothetical protein